MRLILLACLFFVPMLLAEIPSTGWIDVSVNVDPATTPVYEGDAPPKFTWLKSFDKGDTVNLSELDLGAHTGTHVDAPLHFVPHGASVDQIPVDKLVGPARVIECSRDAAIIDAAELNRHQWRGAKRILFKTRNSYQNLLGDHEFHRDFVAIAPDAARLLADSGVVLVGIDYLSAEKFGAPSPDTHTTLLGKNIVIVEGLDLRQVKGGDYDLIILPIKLAGREGAPARALLRQR